MRISRDAFLVFILLLARVRIDTLAQLVLPQRHQDVARLPLTRALLSPKAQEILQDWMTDPLTLLLISVAFGLMVTYLAVDVLRRRMRPELAYRLKLGILYGIIFATVIASSLLLVMLRHISGPAAYTHDGGVIQTEETIKLILKGKNPYVENYVNTPMTEWGIGYRTALYHFPYLPWTFLFSTPFYLVSRALLGWYDQRFVYLLLFVVMLLLAPGLARRPEDKLSLVAVLGLNPIMGSDVIFGQNDSFVLFWVVLSLWLLRGTPSKPRVLLSTAAFALACASKPTAWFFAPFYFLYLLGMARSGRRGPLGLPRSVFCAGVVFIGILALLVVPFAVWDLDAMVDDIWRWSAGTAEIPYQIRGWGVANFVLALGLVNSRLDYFPFWLPELAFSLPALAFALWRQWRNNTIAGALYGYGFLLFGFLYFSRFLNENYLGYIAGILALAYFGFREQDDTDGAQTSETA